MEKRRILGFKTEQRWRVQEKKSDFWLAYREAGKTSCRVEGFSEDFDQFEVKPDVQFVNYRVLSELGETKVKTRVTPAVHQQSI